MDALVCFRMDVSREVNENKNKRVHFNSGPFLDQKDHPLGEETPLFPGAFRSGT